MPRGDGWSGVDWIFVSFFFERFKIENIFFKDLFGIKNWFINKQYSIADLNWTTITHWPISKQKKYPEGDLKHVDT